MTERIETTLRWTGDWPWWIGLPAAALLGTAAFVFYRRDVQSLTWWLRAALPGVRAVAVAMIAVMLSGPVLHHRKTIGQLAKLWIFIDGSQSMALADSSMDAGRKILISQRIGLLQPGAVKLDLPQAAESIAEAESAADRALSMAAIDSAAWSELTAEFAARIDEALSRLSGVLETERLEQLRRDLREPIRELSQRPLRQIDDRNRALKDLAKLGDAARRAQQELRERFEQSIAGQATPENSLLHSAMAKFDSLPRWQRVQSLMLDGEPSRKLLGKLATNHEVQVLALEGHSAQNLWQPTARDSSLPTELPTPTNSITDLASSLGGDLSGLEKDQRGAVILISDGQHNEGGSPVEAAKILSGKKTPIFTVGFGSATRPRDLAFVKAAGPESVFHEDRFRGELLVKDDVPAGQDFNVVIRDGEKVVWEQKLKSENRGMRRVPFDFPIKELAETRRQSFANAAPGAEVTGFPIELKVIITLAEGERQVTNNEGSLRFRAVTQKRRILIVDGRPRWETRYLRNLFERDEQWEVNCVIADSHVGHPGLLRGKEPEHFPEDAASLESYDLIFLGELPRTVWKDGELQWIRDFVEKRGGALILIDGSRGWFKEYGETPLAAIFPVQFASGSGLRENITRLDLTERASQLAAFSLEPDRDLNRATWAKLPAPHWLSEATPLPGTETLIEAEVAGQRRAGAVVRPFGAGKVYYHAFDDSWRWRREVADQWHVRFWNQAANFIAEPPFAVRDKFVALDAGNITYQPGEDAEIRVRLRDGEGKPVSNATVDAVLFKEGKRIATIRLSSGEGSGLFRGRTAALEPGRYEVAVESAAIPESQLKARTSFKVEPQNSGELTQLSLNEDLLQQIAHASGGRYFREENIDRVLQMLEPMSQGRVVESDTVLWQSWWWFLPIIGLFSIEWVLRKRAGML
jgi:hypothetical protein